MKTIEGTIKRVNGPLVTAALPGAGMATQVYIGEEHLIGEIIWINGDDATIQVYEDTTGLKIGEKVVCVGTPLSIELGPGLLSNIFDGIQRPLSRISGEDMFYIKRGALIEKLDRDKKWPFTPKCKAGDMLKEGQIYAEVKETSMLMHRLMVPPGISGKVVYIADKGDYSIAENIIKIETANGVAELNMIQNWPVRKARPTSNRFMSNVPLITGQRIVDLLFPITKGGVAAIPGGFGTGKTMLQHQLAKWSDADVIIYVGCGERGNEMTQVLTEFPALIDPRSGKSLMERTILIANTSNMPVTAREASIYTGITMGEYFRDMGYNVALMADSTSRWAEALREISGRLEELPAEEGYPAYLPSRLAEFYERAGKVETLGHGEGSITIIGAVSPPGGDFSEPVTQNTKRFIRCFWALDRDLASARHFPAVSWIESYSDYAAIVQNWWNEKTPDWLKSRDEMLLILQETNRLSQIAQIVGQEALPDDQRLTLFTGELIKNAILSQNAYDDIDTFCSPEKLIKLSETVLNFYKKIRHFVIAGVPVIRFIELPVVNEIIRAKMTIKNEELQKFDEIDKHIKDALEEFTNLYGEEPGLNK